MSKLSNFKLTKATRGYCLQEIKNMDLTKPKRLNISDWEKKRSLPANSAYNAWIPEIADWMAMTIPETTWYIKLEFGLPILLADDHLGPIIGEGLNKQGYFQLSYEDRMFHMKKLPVTRLFDTKMHNKLRDNLQNHYGTEGLILSYNK